MTSSSAHAQIRHSDFGFMTLHLVQFKKSSHTPIRQQGAFEQLRQVTVGSGGLWSGRKHRYCSQELFEA